MEDGIKQQFQIFRLVMAVMMKCVGVGFGGGGTLGKSGS